MWEQARNTEHTPSYLFFTGGSALRELSRCLARSNPHSIHIVTTFDSGGSTAEIRRCFAIPAMGDLRNRLLALADPAQVSPQILDFFQMRLPSQAEPGQLLVQLRTMASPDHPFWAGTDPHSVSWLCSALQAIVQRLPGHFDLRGASVGNLLLTSIYLEHGRDFEPTLDSLSRFLHVRGHVLPVVDKSLHLGCELADGSFVLGQHNFKKLTTRVRRIFLTVHERLAPSHAARDVCHPPAASGTCAWIGRADAICYPMGSFYSSVLVNLLVRGIGSAIAGRHCPKIFIPNLGWDPELGDTSLLTQIGILLETLRCDAPFARTSDLLHYVLCDPHGDYQGRIEPNARERLAEMGISLRFEPLSKNGDLHDPELTIEALERCLREYRKLHAQV
ncbi:MAG: GAK system CofD-like protein [Desulfovibrio sp.]|nr:GAK system CofD-like protein [Desulfovibrio sp.]